MTSSEVERQREYYATTAAQYDAMHGQDHEHTVALGLLTGMLEVLGAGSVLDVGSGTGRAVEYLQRARRDLRVRGVEPVRELREAGYARGLAPADLVAGDALALPFPNGAFDVVCAFGVLHHVKTPDRAVDEMLRVARLAIFVSDSNNFGQGGSMVRLLKQGLNAVGLWPVVNWLKTRGRGYSLTDGDGLAYSYSVFNSYPRIRRGCRLVHCMNTRLAGPNLYRTATHVAVMGIK